MDRQQTEFSTRVRRIDRRHRKLASGYVATVSHDGLIVPRPRRMRVRVPYFGLALLAVGVIALKGVAFSGIGAEAYGDRVAALAAGSPIERVGAWVMQADPLTVWAAAQVQALLD